MKRLMMSVRYRYGHFKGFTLIAVMYLDEVPKLFVKLRYVVFIE